MRLFGLLLAALIFCHPTSDALADKRAALIIGNSAYRNVAPLPNPVHDAGLVAGLFRSAGFEVVELRSDLGQSEMRRAIRDFSDVVQDADIAVVFYAGHGMEVNRINYLIPVDAKLERDVDVDDEAISLDRVLKIIEPAKRLRLVILDACRDNPFVRTMRRTVGTRSLGRGLAEVETTTSDTLIAFAVKAGFTADDGEGVNSPFTSALVKYLAVPGLDVGQAFRNVKTEVLEKTHGKQEPFLYGSLGRETVALVPPPEASKPPDPASASSAAASDAAEDARRDYLLAELVGTKEAWDAFIAAHRTGFYANLARAQRQKLGSSVASLSAPANAPAGDTADTARQLQQELNRVGCGSGESDGRWETQSRRAIEAFNRNAGTAFDVKVATLEALNAVRARDARVCPQVCGRGFRIQGTRCVEIVCRQGYVLGDDGECERHRSVRTHESPQQEQKEHKKHHSAERHSSERHHKGSGRHASHGRSVSCSAGYWWVRCHY